MRRHHAVFIRAALAVAIQAPLGAVDFVVTRYDDPTPNGCNAGDCSLREAVIAANANPDHDLIRLSAGSYTLTRLGTDEAAADDGDLDLLESVDIVGVGAALTRIVGAGLGEDVFNAEDGSGRFFIFEALSIRDSDHSALSASGGSWFFRECELRDNGGGIKDAAISFGLGSLAIAESTLAGSSGPGLLVTEGDVLLENSTVAENGHHELILSSNASLSCVHCTIVDAPADDFVALAVTESTVSLENSAIVDGCDLSSATVDSGGGNLESPGDTCDLDSPDDLPATAAVKISTLGDHGGQTRTITMAADSPLVGNALSGDCLVVDQRIGLRPADSIGCDIGALERDALEVVTSLFVDGFDQGSPAAWSAAVE
jgi:CSLREA domain-containing protein